MGDAGGGDRGVPGAAVWKRRDPAPAEAEGDAEPTQGRGNGAGDEVGSAVEVQVAEGDEALRRRAQEVARRGEDATVLQRERVRGGGGECQGAQGGEEGGRQRPARTDG